MAEIGEFLVHYPPPTPHLFTPPAAYMIMLVSKGIIGYSEVILFSAGRGGVVPLDKIQGRGHPSIEVEGKGKGGGNSLRFLNIEDYKQRGEY